jgi:hypothetical protein
MIDSHWQEHQKGADAGFGARIFCFEFQFLFPYSASFTITSFA